jgi:hypothetical protein
MAPEDFDSEPRDPAPPDVPTAAVDEDEDLFDFPPADTPPADGPVELTSDQAGALAAEATTRELDRLLADGEVFLADGSDLLDEEDPILVAEAILARAFEPDPDPVLDDPEFEAKNRPARDFEGEIDLDEDIFEFPEDQDPEPRRREPVTTAAVSDRSARTSGDGLSTDEGRTTERAYTFDELAPAPRVDTRALWALVGASLVVNAVVLVFAWRTSATLDENVDAFRSHLVNAVDAMRAQPLQAAPPGGVQDDGGEGPVLDPLRADAALQLRFARDEIAGREFSAARRRLYRLLATADASSDPRADVQRADAAFLIGDAYFQEARERAGEEVLR